MNVLITGITGFVGSHLAEAYLNDGHTVFGTLRMDEIGLDNILHIKDQIKLIDCDITESKSVKQAIEQANPAIIHHLAAQSKVSVSWANPEATLEINMMGTLNVLEGVRNTNTDIKLHVCGSSDEYGLVYPSEIPVTEKNPLRPLSPYAVSKASADLLSMQYHQSYELKIVVTRAFNHTGVRRGDSFVCSNFAKQIALIEKNKQKEIKHGNLDAIKDFTDVRDIINAYILALKTPDCIGKQLNICSGKGYRISEILDILKSLSNLEIKTVYDESRSRPSDVPILIGNCNLFKVLTGWAPEIPLRDTLTDLLNYWRARV